MRWQAGAIHAGIRRGEFHGKPVHVHKAERIHDGAARGIAVHMDNALC